MQNNHVCDLQTFLNSFHLNKSCAKIRRLVISEDPSPNQKYYSVLVLY